MASLKEQSVYNGNIIQLKINGKVIGRAQSVDAQHNWATENLYEVGSIMPHHTVYNQFSGSIRVSKFMIRNADLIKTDIAEAAESVLTKGVMDIEIMDRTTNQAIRVYKSCSIQGYSYTVSANTIVGENATFTYLDAE